MIYAYLNSACLIETSWNYRRRDIQVIRNIYDIPIKCPLLANSNTTDLHERETKSNQPFLQRCEDLQHFRNFWKMKSIGEAHARDVALLQPTIACTTEPIYAISHGQYLGQIRMYESKSCRVRHLSAASVKQPSTGSTQVVRPFVNGFEESDLQIFPTRFPLCSGFTSANCVPNLVV